MATVLKRQESRRRLAAITFLSNISLDGTHRDTKLAPFVIRDNYLDGSTFTNNYPNKSNFLQPSSYSTDPQKHSTLLPPGFDHHQFDKTTTETKTKTLSSSPSSSHNIQHLQLPFQTVNKSSHQDLRQSSSEKRLYGNSLTFGGSGHINGSSEIVSSKLGILDENGEFHDVSPSQSRRQSCSLPLGQHCSTKDVRSSNDPADEDTRGVLSSVGSCKRSRHNLSSSSILNHQLNSCESKSSIVTQQSHRSRNGSVSRGGNEIPLNSGKTITETTRHQVRFQHSLKEQTVQNEKIVFVASKRAPVALFSYIPFSRKSNNSINSQIKQDLINKRRHAGGRQLSTIADSPDPYESICIVGYERPMDGQEVSYSNLLSPTIKLLHGKKAKVHSVDHNFVNRCISYDSTVTNYPSKQSIGNNHYHLLHQMTAPSVLNDSESNLLRDKHQYPGYPTTFLKYNPDILDDPELITGKHSTLLDFPSYLTSIINYVKPSDLKKELNEKFRERFPYIQLTLSKMRSLKRDMCKIAKHEGNIDYLTVAQAYVYFEKLILKLLINKQNRKLCAGACLLLSAKLNDVKGVELKKLIEKIENTFRVDRKDLFSIEFTVLVALEFGLHLPINETLSHYQRLMFET